MEVVVCVTIENSVFYLALYLTGKYFRGKLQHVGDVSEQKKVAVNNAQHHRHLTESWKHLI